MSCWEEREGAKESPLGSQEILTGVPTSTAEDQVAAPATDESAERQQEKEEQGPWEMPIQETGPHLPQELAQ